MNYGSADFTLFLVDGYDLLPAKVQSFTEKIEAVQERADGLGDPREAMAPTGLTKLSIAQTGAFFDDRAHGMHALFSTLPPIARTVMYSFTGGKTVSTASGVFVESYAVVAQQGRLTRANVTYQVNGAIMPNGVGVQPLQTFTAAWVSAVADSGAEDARGLLLTLQVVDLVGFTSVAITLEHSVDGAAGWVPQTLPAITAAPATAQIPVAGPVHRYLRLAGTPTPPGAGHVTLAMSAIRT
jgi:hypothetical protein